MSDSHQAAIPTVRSSRSDVILRVATTLRDHGLAFDGGIHGLHWDAEVDSWAYDDEDDRDLDGLESIDAALSASEPWERVCLDFSGLSTNWELHASRAAASTETDVALLFPHALYKLAASEVATARRLVHLFDDIRLTLTAKLLVCGTGVPEQGGTLTELRRFVDRELQQHVPTALRLQTMIASAAIEDELRREHPLATYWRRLELPSDGRALSQLPIDE